MRQRAVFKGVYAGANFVPWRQRWLGANFPLPRCEVSASPLLKNCILHTNLDYVSRSITITHYTLQYKTTVVKVFCNIFYGNGS
jgi:hypothetical protein